MSSVLRKIPGMGLDDSDYAGNNRIRISIATKLVLSFLMVIVLTGAIFTAVGIVLISNHIVTDARQQSLKDLDRAREVYQAKVGQVGSVVFSTANSSRVQDAVSSGNMGLVSNELLGIKFREALDILTITDARGNVLLRTSNLGISGDNISHQDLIGKVIGSRSPAATTTEISQRDLRSESRTLAKRVAETMPNSVDNDTGEVDKEMDVMMIGAAAPIFDSQASFIGIVQGGILLSSNPEFICDIKYTLFNSIEYGGKDIGFATIYQDDVEILTCPRVGDRTGIVSSIASHEVADQVLVEGKLWAGRDFLRDSWYVTASEPIRNSEYETVGILQVGQLEQVYLDIKNQMIVAFLAITLIGAFVSIIFAYFISRRISDPLEKLVFASRQVAHGNLDVRIDTASMANDELSEMAVAFNSMASALEERDAELKELTTRSVGRTERLAIIGRLSANVAHELNNPLQGIVTYSHLLIERMTPDNPSLDYIQKIVVQANRCRDIIRGLLDFARQRETVKTLCDVNLVLYDCIALLENQALFHNIEVVKEFDAEMPLAVVDASQIERVFINMIINAAEAMDGVGRLTLVTGSGPSEECVEVVIADTGQGISNENLGRIFDPFFTTKEVGRGTGLGLAISYGIIKEHGGTVSVKSEVGQYTTFTVRLPVKQGIVLMDRMAPPDMGKELTLLSEL